MKTNNEIKLDTDSKTLGQQMKQEIDKLLKTHSKPSLTEIAEQNEDEHVHFKFIFGDYCNPAHLNYFDTNVCIFKISDFWFLEENVFDWNGSGVHPIISGPLTYNQAKDFFITKYLKMPSLVKSDVLSIEKTQLKFDRFHSLKKLNEYLKFDQSFRDSIENYISNLYDYLKSDLTKDDSLNLYDNKVEFKYYRISAGKRYEAYITFDYHQTPFTYQWERVQVDNKNFEIGKWQKGRLFKYANRHDIYFAFASMVKLALHDSIQIKLNKNGDEAKIELYKQWKRLKIAQDYEKTFDVKLTFDEFYYFYSLDKKSDDHDKHKR